jgi:hypothetical protein
MTAEEVHMKKPVLVSFSILFCLSTQAAEVERDYKFCREAITNLAQGKLANRNRNGYQIPFEFKAGTDAMAEGNESPTLNPKVYKKSVPAPVKDGLPETVTLKTTQKDGIVAKYEIEHLDNCEKSMLGFAEPNCRKKQLVFDVEVNPVTNVCYFKSITYKEFQNGVSNTSHPIMNEKICDYLDTHRGDKTKDIVSKFLEDPENQDGKWIKRFQLDFQAGKTGASSEGRRIRNLDANCNSYVQGYGQAGGPRSNAKGPNQSAPSAK